MCCDLRAAHKCQRELYARFLNNTGSVRLASRTVMSLGWRRVTFCVHTACKRRRHRPIISFLHSWLKLCPLVDMQATERRTNTMPPGDIISRMPTNDRNPPARSNLQPR